MTTKKLTEQELQQVKKVQEKHQIIAQELGQIELAKLDLVRRRESVETFLEEVLKEERDLAQYLEDIYGRGTIDLEQGVLITVD